MTWETFLAGVPKQSFCKTPLGLAACSDWGPGSLWRARGWIWLCVQVSVGTMMLFCCLMYHFFSSPIGQPLGWEQVLGGCAGITWQRAEMQSKARSRWEGVRAVWRVSAWVGVLVSRQVVGRGRPGHASWCLASRSTALHSQERLC